MVTSTTSVYAPEFRTKIEDLENILIYTPSGEGIRVKDLGKVVERSAPPTIERKDRERIVTVSAVISGAPLGDVVADGNAIIDKMDLPSLSRFRVRMRTNRIHSPTWERWLY